MLRAQILPEKWDCSLNGEESTRAYLLKYYTNLKQFITAARGKIWTHHLPISKEKERIMSLTNLGKSIGGRPPKFNEGCHPITVTLPERILKLLEQVSSDRALALVKCVEAAIGTGEDGKGPVELVEVLPKKALIVVNSSRSLNRIEWLRMVEIAPSRFLLVLPPGMPIERLEVEMRDVAESLDSCEESERLLLEQLQTVLIQQRRQKALSKGELLFVDLPR